MPETTRASQPFHSYQDLHQHHQTAGTAHHAQHVAAAGLEETHDQKERDGQEDDVQYGDSIQASIAGDAVLLQFGGGRPGRTS